LLYVGMTRAKQRLYLSYAFRRTSYGRTNLSTPSRFLSDIPRVPCCSNRRSVVRGVSPQTRMFTDRGMGARGWSDRSATTWGDRGSSRQRAAGPGSAPVSETFFAGQRVRHPTFGEGIVISSRVLDDDEEVTVSFGSKERRLLAGFARLERIET
jgi:DNA helicase-2/ATP-dependent DNA helicase PcrA